MKTESNQWSKAFKHIGQAAFWITLLVLAFQACEAKRAREHEARMRNCAGVVP